MKLLCSNGVKAVLLELIPDFERTSGSKLDIVWASTNMLMPSTSESRMNSWRFSEESFPVLASQSTAISHSSCFRSTSRAKP